MIEVEGLHKFYGRTKAVDGVAFDVARGEVFGLLGPNGAGKTTIIGVLTGLFPPTAGWVRIAGLDVQAHAHAAKSRIGLVPQELALYPTLSARDNLIYFGWIQGIRGRRLDERIKAVLRMVGLVDRADDAVQTFSGGMKRRVNLAVGLLHEPEVLLLDEPTVGVDPQSRNAIFEGIESLKRAGLTILYTTHYMEEAQRLCDRVAIVDHGKIIALDTPEALVGALGGALIQVGLGEGRAEAVADQASRLPSVRSIVRRNGHLELQSSATQESIVGLLEITNRLDAPITSLQILEPSLETVFLRLTGKRLRD